MDITINAATKQQYLGNLDSLVRERASPYDGVPAWGTYVGNGRNDAWNKADAALRTWPSLNPGFAKLGGFPKTPQGAKAALRTLGQVESAESHAGKAGAGDPLNVGFHGDPEQKAAQTHDFGLGVATAAHDLRGQIAANNRFALDSLQCAAAARATGDPVRAYADEGAAAFIGGGASGLATGQSGAQAAQAAVARAAVGLAGQAAQAVAREVVDRTVP